MDLLFLQNIKKINVVSIDAEGHEMQILDGFDIKKYDPEVLVIENLPNSNGLREYMKDKGYNFAKRLQVDDCYIKNI